jgi:hypothetical protein
MALTEEQSAAVFQRGREITTNMAATADAYEAYAASFEARGGAGAMPSYGNEVLEIVYFGNDLAVFLTPERRATLAKYRLDY